MGRCWAPPPVSPGVRAATGPQKQQFGQVRRTPQGTLVLPPKVCRRHGIVGHGGGGSLKALLKHQGEIPSSKESQLPLHCGHRTRMGIPVSSLGSLLPFSSTTINPNTALPGEILMLLGPRHTVTSLSLHSHEAVEPGTTTKPLSIICPQNSRGWAWRLS